MKKLSSACLNVSLVGMIAMSSFLPYFEGATVVKAESTEVKPSKEPVKATPITNTKGKDDTSTTDKPAVDIINPGSTEYLAWIKKYTEGLYLNSDRQVEILEELKNGNDLYELSPYLMESVQGVNRGTYVPNLKTLLENQFLYENDYASLRENRFFTEDSKREFFFSQDGNYSLEYSEALNWLYKNNLIHRFDNVKVDYERGAKESKATYKKQMLKKEGKGKSQINTTLSAGKYTVAYQMYNLEDSITIDDYSNRTLAQASGKKTGTLEFEVKKEEEVTVHISAIPKSSWWYSISKTVTKGTKALGKSTITLTEDSDKSSVFYPYVDSNGQNINRAIKRKDFIMQLMKVVDGVEESRPLLIQSQYAFRNQTGQVTNRTAYYSLIETMFANQMQQTGIDGANSDVVVNYNEFGMHHVYVNPNVYELYLAKAYNSKIIEGKELTEKEIVNYAKNGMTYSGKQVVGDISLSNSCVNQTKKKGNYVPKWSNKMPPVRVNTRDAVDNNSIYRAIAKTRIFGKSWTDTSTDCSNEVNEKHNFKYTDHEYFTKEFVSYMQAVQYTYKAINAYSDEKLTDKEVDAIVSTYSVNYGNLNASDKKALNYLIAKGIIDGNQAAKYTSPQEISTEDAITMLYRVANKSARLTPKLILTTSEQKMLDMGFGQSNTSLTEFDSELPDIEFTSDGVDAYNIILNKTLAENEYKLGTSALNPLDDETIVKEQATWTADELETVGVTLPAGEYTVVTYLVPWGKDFPKLGLTMDDAKTGLPNWVAMALGGGYYYVEDNQIGVEGTNSLDRVSDDFGGYVEDTDTTYEEDEEVEEEESTDDLLFGMNEKQTTRTKQTVESGSIELPTYSKKASETVAVYVGINKVAKNSLYLDGIKLYKSGKLNPKVLNQAKDIKNIKEVDAKKASSDADNRTFLEFTFPVIANQSTSELKSLLKRRLTLSGDAEAKDTDIATYTGLSSGETLISQKELKRFGIISSKEEPDVLRNKETNTYAYLNPAKDYALISNTLMKFPKDSLMIEVTADDIYYNIKVVMSLINKNDFYVFNDDGKIQIVKKMKDAKYEQIFNPETEGVMDSTSTATVTNVGSFVNISAVSGEPATYFMAFNKIKGKEYKRIYGFEPYYVKSSAKANTAVTAEKVVSELKLKSSDIFEIQNLLINNAVLRNEFGIDKSETFIYTDNAMKVTAMTESKSVTDYANDYLDFLESVQDGLSAKDVQVDTVTLEDDSPKLRNKNFKLTDLMEKNLFSKTTNAETKKLISSAKAGNNRDAFWILYLADKFNVDAPGDDTAFYKALAKSFNKRYKVPSGVKIEKKSDFSLLLTAPFGETDIRDKRLYSIKKMEATDQGKLSHDKVVFIGKNEAVYVRNYAYSGAKPAGNRNNQLADASPVNEITRTLASNNGVSETIMKSYSAPTYLNGEGTVDDDGSIIEQRSRTSAGKAYNKSVPTAMESKTQSVRDMLGTAFYTYNKKLYSPIVEQYRSLPNGERPLESMPNGYAFSMLTANGTEEFILVNNMVSIKTGKKDYLTAKIVRAKAKPLSNSLPGKTKKVKAYNYYTDTAKYKKSARQLGKFSSAIYTGSIKLKHTLGADEIERTIYDTNQRSVIFFDYPKKAKNSVYHFPTNIKSSSNLKWETAYPKHIGTLEITSNMSSEYTKLLFGVETRNQLAGVEPPNKSGNEWLYKKGTKVTENYMLYDSFLVNYGSISLDYQDNASYLPRSTNIMNTSAVLTDLSNELVKAIKIDRTKVSTKKISDLKDTDKLLIYKEKSNNLYAIRTGAKTKKGYSRFVTNRPTSSNISANELLTGNSLLLKNYKIFESTKISTGKDKLPLYYFIGNSQLNIASSAMIEKYSSQMNFGLGTTNTFITEGTSNGKTTSSSYIVTHALNKSTGFSGKKKAIDFSKQLTSYPYFMTLYLDANLHVKKNDKGYYEIVGYDSDTPTNTEAFLSRVDRFEGVFDGLLTVLPSVLNISGRQLGFELGKAELDSLRKIFTYNFWSDLLSNSVQKAEQVLSMIGIYYVYLLMVLVALGRTIAPNGLYKWIFSPVKFMTFGKIDVHDLDLVQFYSKAIFIVILLTLTYNGFIRIMILKFEEFRAIIVNLFSMFF